MERVVALRRIAQWVESVTDFASGDWWIIVDTGFAKKGTHSVGVTRQYCGVLGKQDNCQVAVSVALACEKGSPPVAWEPGRQKDRRLQIDRSGLFFADFLPNISIFGGEIVKNYPGWGQFSLRRLVCAGCLLHQGFNLRFE